MTLQRSSEYWNTTPIHQLSKLEWEAICDGCAIKDFARLDCGQDVEKHLIHFKP